MPEVLTLARRDAHDAPPPDADGPELSLATAPPRTRYAAAVEADRYVARRRRLAIRRRRDDELIAAIELISPGNKSSRYAFDSLISKALELLDAGVHLLLIDVFPPGRRDPHGLHGAIRSELADEPVTLPDADARTFAACSAGSPGRAFVEWPTVGSLLPDMPLFLEPERHAAVPLESTDAAALSGTPRRLRAILEP